MRENVEMLTREEKVVILNAIEYMVDGGLTSFDLSLYESIWNKLKEEDDPSFPDVE